MMTAQPVQPVEAATVVLARHGDPTGTPWECFMVRRHGESNFAADVFVFPGGKVDDADRSNDLVRFADGHPGLVGDPRSWRALRFAALRELFEEAGVLLARREDGQSLSVDGEETIFSEYRDQLQEGKVSLRQIAERERLIYSLDRLAPISRWITPESSPRRFDTHFFVALLPEDQEPLHDARETTAGMWISPAEALRRYSEGSFPLVFATVKNLERLAEYASIESLITSTAADDLAPIMPRMVKRNGETHFLMPGDEGY